MGSKLGQELGKY